MLGQSDNKQQDVVGDSPEAETAPDQVITKRFSAFGPILAKLFASGVEARGVERVPENQRETKNMWNK